MAKDLNLYVDEVCVNIRCGAIMRSGDDVVLEVSRVGVNSVIPGGRIKINESSRDAIKREMLEEMGIAIRDDALSFVTVLENFFEYNSIPVHEIFFIYEYNLDKEEVSIINALCGNNDNSTTYFKFVDKNAIEGYDLLPLTLHRIINNK